MVGSKSMVSINLMAMLSSWRTHISGLLRTSPDELRMQSPTSYQTCFTPSSTITEHSFSKVIGQKKRLTIIYNYYNKATTILESVDSIKKQNWKNINYRDIEIIVVDDGTPDEDISKVLPEEIIYLKQRKVRYGICRAKNTGARLANGEYLLFLDPDIMLGSDFIESMLERFSTFGDRLVQTGYIWGYHYEGCEDPRVEFGVWEKPNRLTRRFFQVAGGNLALSKDLFFKTAGFDEDLIYGGVEDLLFGYHLSKIPETKIMFNSQMESWHIPHPPGGAHADTNRTWEIVAQKWPEFDKEYRLWGMR